MGIDPIQHALCEDNTKQEIKRQRLFGVDKHVFTYNGDKAGKQYIEFNGAYVVRVGPVIDPETVTEVLLVVLDGENLIEAPLPKDLISFDKAPLEELGLNGTMLIYDNNAWFACVVYESTDAVTAGTYVIDNMEGDGYKFYTSCIKAETIHPIDQKFIPGAPLFDLTEMGLPTVELGSMAMVENIDVSEISAAMDAGNIKIKTLVNIDGVEMDVYANLLSAYLPAAQAREATTVLSFDGKIYAVILTVAQSYINFAVSEV